MFLFSVPSHFSCLWFLAFGVCSASVRGAWGRKLFYTSLCLPLFIFSDFQGSMVWHLSLIWESLCHYFFKYFLHFLTPFPFPGFLLYFLDHWIKSQISCVSISVFFSFPISLCDLTWLTFGTLFQIHLIFPQSTDYLAKYNCLSFFFFYFQPCHIRFFL